ncbi:putative acyl-coenzyme A synthetase [Glarea lozoyensis 74030]|uniref:Putative acyl-coenzyme A synthetase n=1 Tax=Glarea lozoyensis (strain ATCC 74030 / MF5533) TaxID=1104152 RepID=H0EDY2_GLAL7|nr:putative acyl-coenzyme A synthetase [Glarea lozoyensis 74030]
MLYLGIVAAGGVFTGTNPSYTQYELTHHIKTAKAKFLITEPEMLGAALAAGKQCKIPHSKTFIFDVHGQEFPEGYKSWKVLLDHGEKDWRRFDDFETASNTTAARMFSSGTTGLPKAAVVSHYNLIAQHELAYSDHKPFRGKRILALPMFHAAAAPAGQLAIVMRRFDLEEYLANIEKWEINEVGIVPPIAIGIIMSPLNKKYSLKSVQQVMIGAAPLGRDSQKRLRDLLPKEAMVLQVWGMTEMTCIGSMFPYPEDDDTGSVGRVLPHCEAKIIDDAGKDISAYDTRGELCIRGPIVVKGYFENPAANAESFDSEGFFKTGDIVYCDSKTQKWYVVDRKKELIKVRGFQVAPPELETVLLSHPHIIDAAVIGAKCPQDPDVELPRAYVVRRDSEEGKKLSVEDVKKWSGSRLAKFKELTGGVIFVDSIPKNASGKILKRILREQAKKEMDASNEKARL